MTTYNQTISEAGNAAEALGNSAVTIALALAAANARNASSATLSLAVSASGAVTTSAGFKWLAGGSVSELGIGRGSATLNAVYGVTVAELAQSVSTLSTAVAASISEHATVSATITAIAAAIVQERARGRGYAAPQGTFNAQVAETAKAISAILKALHGSVSEHSTVTSAFINQYIAAVKIVERANAQNYLVNSNIVYMTVAETGQITDQEIIKALYSNTITESGYVSIEYAAPDGSTATWVVNTRTNAVTEYRNWQYNSFASIGRKYIAASRTGLYELNGTRDGTENIVADMAGGYLQMNGAKFAGLKGVYIGMRGEGDYLLKLIAGDGREYTYQFNPNPNLMTTKVKIGKGLRARYIQWELISTGSDFDLDSIEFVPMVSDRRV